MSAVIVSIAGGQASGKKTVLAALERRLLELSANRLSIATLHMSGFQRSSYARRASSVSQPTNVLLTSQTDGSISLVSTPEAAHPTTTTTTQPTEGGNKDISESLAEEDDEGMHAFDLASMASAAELVVSGDLDPSEVGGGLSQSRGRLGGGNQSNSNGNTPKGGVDVLLMEGHYLLCHKRLLEMANIKVFVDLDADVRLGWRVLRDTEENRMSLDTVFDHYVRFGKRAFEETIYPTKTLADIILPRGPESAAIDLIAMGVWDDIRARKDEQVRLLKQGIAALQVGSAGLSVGAGVPGHFSPLRSYSPTRPYVSKNRITIGEADLENFYGSVSS